MRWKLVPPHSGAATGRGALGRTGANDAASRSPAATSAGRQEDAGRQKHAARLAVMHSVPFWLPLTATWLYNQVKYLPSHVNSRVICHRTENGGQFRFEPIHLTPPAGFGSAWHEAWSRLRGGDPHTRNVLDVARRFQVDVLHSHWGDWAYGDLKAVRRARMAHVVTFYGKDVNYLPVSAPKWRSRYRRLFREVDLVLCEGPHMRQCLMELGCPGGKVRVQRLGIEVERIEFRPRQFGPGQPLRVLIAASFRQKKGIPYALEALGRVQQEGCQVEVTIIGDACKDARSHPEKRRILQTLRDWKLEGCTRLLGYQPHQRLFQEAYAHHLFLSPSLTADDGDTEGGAPVTLIEMAATGIPIVSTTHCDIPSVVLHGKTGLLAPERNAAALAEHIRWWLGHRDEWQSMLAAGRRHVEEKFNVVAQARQLAELYRALCFR